MTGAGARRLALTSGHSAAPPAEALGGGAALGAGALLGGVLLGDGACKGRQEQGKMARPEGFEPPTNGFGSHYSIRLSYERVVVTLPVTRR